VRPIGSRSVDQKDKALATGLAALKVCDPGAMHPVRVGWDEPSPP